MAEESRQTELDQLHHIDQVIRGRGGTVRAALDTGTQRLSVDPLPLGLVYLAVATVVRREDYERYKSELERVAREAVGAAVADYLWRQHG